MDQPVVCAVNGICGGGLEFALSCDLLIASETATFALPEIRSGSGADAVLIKLPKRIPYHAAMDLPLTRRWFGAAEARGRELVKEIVNAEDLREKARGLARLLESGPPIIYAAIKEIVREAEDIGLQDALNRITKRRRSIAFIPAKTRSRARKHSQKNATLYGADVSVPASTFFSANQLFLRVCVHFSGTTFRCFLYRA